MKLTYFILMLSLLGTFHTYYCAKPATDIQPSSALHHKPQLIEREKIYTIVVAHLSEIIKNKPQEYTWLPGYYLKKGSDRIKGALALREYIKRHSLNLITVPEKWAIPIDKNMLDESTVQYLEKIKHTKRVKISDWHVAQFVEDPNIIVSKKLITDPKACMTLPQAKQVYCLLSQAQCDGKYYADAHAHNVVLCADGTVGFLDTELEGFSYDNTYGLSMVLEHGKITPEAQKFLQQKRNELIPSQFPATPRLIVKPFKDQ